MAEPKRRGRPPKNPKPENPEENKNEEQNMSTEQETPETSATEDQVAETAPPEESGEDFESVGAVLAAAGEDAPDVPAEAEGSENPDDYPGDFESLASVFSTINRGDPQVSDEPIEVPWDYVPALGSFENLDTWLSDTLPDGNAVKDAEGGYTAHALGVSFISDEDKLETLTGAIDVSRNDIQSVALRGDQLVVLARSQKYLVPLTTFV